ncbi:MAG: VCBS repeat-containing protein [Chitinophagaceae bacterium]|nr:VCBS repeat-containing protein [Chitinophagaceae bacterium]
MLRLNKLPRILFFSFCLLAALTVYACRNTNNAEKGSELSKTYCGSCHQYPAPELLDKQTWRELVLPVMGNFFGIETESQSSGWDKKPTPLATNGKQQTLSKEDWKLIVDFYVSNAPDTLSRPEKDIVIADTIPGFEIFQSPAAYGSPSLSYIGIDTSSKTSTLLIADLSQQYIYRYSSKLKVIDSVRIADGAVVNLDIHQNRIAVCNVGQLSPNNGKSGKGQQLLLSNTGSMEWNNDFNLPSLARPVELRSLDLDGDGDDDYLVSEFGHNSGALSWRRSLGNNQYEVRSLRALPGCIETIIRDVNADGRPDIFALFTQADEGIFLFTNLGNGEFKEQRILQFPASYGSSSFELIDIDKDNDEDIVYTCGDNSDFSPILKPYHGVYIYLNDGALNFSRKFFFPINGCYKSRTADYDHDGNLDIATISFFADYANLPEEGFVYLHNNGNLNFSAYSFKQSVLGRWLTMDAGDLDGDGNIDLVLGNLSIGPYNSRPKNEWVNGPRFFYLRNKSKPANYK